MADHDQKTTGGSTPSHLKTDHHITLISGSRAGKGRSTILPDLIGDDQRVNQNSTDPKPMGGAYDPAR